MRVCIFGAGAIGGMLGFLLNREGVDVTLIARRETLQRNKEKWSHFYK